MKFEATLFKKKGFSNTGQFSTIMDAKAWGRSHGVPGRLVISERLNDGSFRVISETKV